MKFKDRVSVLRFRTRTSRVVTLCSVSFVPGGVAGSSAVGVGKEKTVVGSVFGVLCVVMDGDFGTCEGATISRVPVARVASASASAAAASVAASVAAVKETCEWVGVIECR